MNRSASRIRKHIGLLDSEPFDIGRFMQTDEVEPVFVTALGVRWHGLVKRGLNLSRNCSNQN